MNTIGKIKLDLGLIEDIRAYFGNAMTIEDVPIHELTMEHVCLAWPSNLPIPDEKIESSGGYEEIYLYNFNDFKFYIFFSRECDPSIFIGDKNLTWAAFFSEIHATTDPVILADTLINYDVDGIEALTEAHPGDSNVAIWINYNFDIDSPFDRAKFCFLSNDRELVKSTLNYNPFMPKIFSSYALAEKFIRDTLKRDYICRPYEISRPTFTIVKTEGEFHV